MFAPRGRMEAPSVQASGSLAERKERVVFHKSRASDHLLAGGLPYSYEAAEFLAEAPLTFLLLLRVDLRGEVLQASLNHPHASIPRDHSD